MSKAFYIAHTTNGRTRIKWAGDSSDKASIMEIAENIAAIPGVDQTVPRITTGSIIIEHEQADWPSVESLLSDRLALEFTTPALPEPRTGLDTINLGLDQMNTALKGMNTDLSSVTVFLLVMLAIAQALRGQVIGPSFSFLWYALSIATSARGTAVTTIDTTADIIE